MPLVLALLCALLLAPGPAPAQQQMPPQPSPWSSQQPWSSQSQSNLTPTQRCERSHQDCVRACFGGDTRTCMSNCDTTRAYCIQNPSTANQPRR